MNQRAAKQMKVGDRVYFGDDATDVGEVIEVTTDRIYVRWERPQQSIRSYPLTDMRNIHHLKTAEVQKVFDNLEAIKRRRRATLDRED